MVTEQYIQTTILVIAIDLINSHIKIKHNIDKSIKFDSHENINYYLVLSCHAHVIVEKRNFQWVQV